MGLNDGSTRGIPRRECSSGYCGWDPVTGSPHTCPEGPWRARAERVMLPTTPEQIAGLLDQARDQLDTDLDA